MTAFRQFGAALPAIREALAHHLEARGLSRERVLAAAIRLVDLGFFRPGGEEYAEQNGTFGLATITKGHVTVAKGQLVFEYLAKGSQQHERAVAEEQVCAVVRSLLRRRGGGDQLLAYQSGSRWHDVTGADMNDYLREVAGGDYTAKDFRTWHATVLAAVGLAVSESAIGSETARRHAIVRVVQEVAVLPGQHPRRGPGLVHRPPRHRAYTRAAAPLLPRWASWARMATSVTSLPEAGQKAPW